MTSTAFDDHERLQWAGKAAAYRDSFAALCAYPAGSLLDAAEVGAGVRVLDVGTGTGTVAALACARAAKVTAVDAEPSMLAIAGRRAPDAETRHAILPHLPFPAGSFDAVVANFVINHVGDPEAAVREMRRVVRPGGRLAVTIWPYPPPPAQQLWTTIFEAAAVPRPTDLPRVAPEKDFARDADGLAGLLGRAGLGDVRCDTITWTHRTHPEAWWAGPANGIGTAGTLLLRQDQATIARIRHHYDRHTDAYRDAGGELELPTAALLAVAPVD
ncbi:class I SAM-dependent methyltransferase [Actinoplanes sp. KI2]|uniref:class I SAM-dependent methyltransferase n=1 Tax=Actinoplanes sp. KI2 TaxID=2983315 RepID=UPI0021D5B2D0|nr:class I SAM-dependent methyltransferase [Actinoplanes sp. KI2]MCU7724696.1 class I SAM-dependent methyltransferase [Actinoplanes sp. KI2]